MKVCSLNWLIKLDLYFHPPPLTARGPREMDEAFILATFAVDIFFKTTEGGQKKSDCKVRRINREVEVSGTTSYH